MEKELEQQEQTKEIRNNKNERQTEREWLAWRSGSLSMELLGTVCLTVFCPSILNKQVERILRTIRNHSIYVGCVSMSCFCFMHSQLT